MPQALQTIVGFKQTLTGGGGFADTLTPGTGDSFTFQDANGSPCGVLAEIWGCDDASPCEFSFTASRFHDRIEGIAGWVPDGSTLAPPNRQMLVSPKGADQPIYASDVMTVRAAGTAGDNVNVCLNLYYTDLPGIAARLFPAATVLGMTVNLLGVDASVTPGAGDWGTSVSLSAATRRLDAERYYAVLGFTAEAPLATVAISGFETGNLRIGGPVVGDGEHDATQILDLARWYNAALVPVIAGNNQDNVLVWAADTNAGATGVTVQLAELSTRPG